ncbi:hypothetical protein BJ165DRAFT_1404803 [Panaeolus papilionaceus]|nr:hypothetical protein BJ165DRAFT_1404803 [Panaeolus papilionaceus]
MVFRNIVARLTGNQIKSTDLVFVVIGPTGVGKSSFINMVARQNVLKVGKGSELKTVTTSITHVLCGSRSSQRIVLVDTPPFPLRGEDREQMERWMQKRYSIFVPSPRHSPFLGRNVNFHGILYLHQITDRRLVQDPASHFHTFESLAGERFHSRVALVTTRWDELRNPDDGLRRETQIEQGIWADMIGKGSVVLRYRNSPESATEILDQIVSMSILSRS